MPDPGFAQPAVAGDRRCLAGGARAAARLRREGDARGRRPHLLDRAGRRATRRAVQACVDAAFDDPTVARRAGAACWTRVAGPGWSNALAAKLLELTDPGRARRLPGQRAVGAEPGRPRQPAAGRLRRPRPQLLAEVRTGRRPLLACAPDDAARRSCCSCHQALTLRRDRPELFTGYAPLAAEGPAADHLLAFDRGGAITAGHPAAGRPGRAGRLGRHRRCRCRRDAGATWSRDGWWRPTSRRVLAGRRARPATRSRCWCARSAGPGSADASTSGRRCRSGSGCRSPATGSCR